jgi:hypothetical protein
MVKWQAGKGQALLPSRGHTTDDKEKTSENCARSQARSTAFSKVQAQQIQWVWSLSNARAATCS